MSDPEILLNALRVISRTNHQGQHLRDQIMGHLHLQGTSLRRIAFYAGLDHSTVAKKCHELGNDLEDLETLLPTRRHLYPASDIITISPRKMIAVIVNQFSHNYEPVKIVELERIEKDVDGLWNLPQELSPPAWDWMLVQTQVLLDHLFMDRGSVRAEEPASMYRRALMSQQWRVEILGIDALAVSRDRTLDVMGRLTVEAERRDEKYG